MVPVEIETDETERTALVPFETMAALVFGADETTQSESEAA